MRAWIRASIRAEATMSSPIQAVSHLAKEGWAGEGPVLSLGQGVVYWDPPPAPVAAVREALSSSQTHKYGEVQGRAGLLSLLRQKLEAHNKLDMQDKEVIVTAGANQGFLATMMVLADPGDEVILFVPYFFNHQMALTLLNITPRLVRSLPDGQPPPLETWPWSARTRAVVVCSPCNPTGAVVPPATLQKIQQACLERQVWLVSDEAYEQFHWPAEGAASTSGPFSPCGPNVVSLFTFSKGYAMAGWRIGYCVFPRVLAAAYAKVQDTIPINVTQASQHLAQEVLCLPDFGRQWLNPLLHSLQANRRAVWQAIKPYTTHSQPSQGGIYMWIPLPAGCALTDMEAVQFLTKQFGVLVLPGSAFGDPSGLRASFGNLPPDKCAVAAERLARGLQALGTVTAKPALSSSFSSPSSSSSSSSPPPPPPPRFSPSCASGRSNQLAVAHSKL